MVRKNFNQFSLNEAPAPPPTLADRIAQAHAFFDPQNLADLIIRYDGKIALLVIDVQRVFCDPQQAIEDHGEILGGSTVTEATSQCISTIIPQFRNAGIPVYPVYYAAPWEDIDYYKYIPSPEDTVILKNKASAFAGGNIKDVLEKDGIKLLLTCGFNFSACVSSTVLDARAAGFEVCVMEDLTKDGFGYTQKEHENERHLMSDSGATFSTSDQILHTIQRQPRQPAAFASA